jgi:hypothetical protein
MEYRSKNNGWRTFSERWGFLSVVVVAVLTSQVLDFFSRLSGELWIWFYGIALGIALFGVCLIFYAKLPLYRERRFLTFGSGALPESRRSFYGRGYGCAVFAVVLLFRLFLSRP